MRRTWKKQVEVEGQRKKRWMRRTWKKQVEEEGVELV